MQMVRQGDVLLVKVDHIPDNVKEVSLEAGRLVLAHGEATGHAHVVEGEAVFLSTDVEEMERRFLRVEEEARVVHDEHDAIVLEPGEYEVVRQREYRPEAPIRVAD